MTGSNYGYGQMSPGDAGSDYNTLQFIINQTLARVRTMVLVKVVAADGGGAEAAPGTVNVTPLVDMLDGAGNAFHHGTILNIPVFRLQGGTNAVICDPAVDDIGWMAVADRDISAIKAEPAAGQGPPGSFRRFDIADGVYMGALFGAVPEQYVHMGEDGIIIADKNGNKIEMASGLITITGNVKVSGTLEVEDTIEATGEITTHANLSGIVTLSQHKHAANNTPPTPGF